MFLNSEVRFSFSFGKYLQNIAESRISVGGSYGEKAYENRDFPSWRTP